MQTAGIITGKDGNCFDPQGSATRAEATETLQRCVELVIDSATANGWTKNDSGYWLYYKDCRAFTGSDARKPMPVKKSPFAIPFAVPAMSAIKSVAALNLNYVVASAKLLLSSTAVINLVINALFPSYMNTMPKLHTACILNGSFQPCRALV